MIPAIAVEYGPSHCVGRHQLSRRSQRRPCVAHCLIAAPSFHRSLVDPCKGATCFRRYIPLLFPNHRVLHVRGQPVKDKETGGSPRFQQPAAEGATHYLSRHLPRAFFLQEGFLVNQRPRAAHEKDQIAGRRRTATARATKYQAYCVR